VRSALGGDEGAFQTLVIRHENWVAAIMRRKNIPPHALAERIQDVWVRLFHTMHQWRRRAAYCKWLGTVTARIAIDYHRRSGPPEVSFDQVPEPTVPDDLRGPPDFGRIRECLERRAASLPSQLRAIYDAILQGRNNREIIATLGMPPSTFYFRLNETRRILKPCLDPDRAE
jgi:DNA-directed RNA polymerase specialized sigma24 family protein